jgi:hypothetical protein
MFQDETKNKKNLKEENVDQEDVMLLSESFVTEIRL